MEKSVTALFGLVGRRLGHSFSQKFFREKFRSEAVEADYINIELDDIAMLRGVVADMPRLCGFNVTIPYKQSVMALLDSVDIQAAEIGAVNTVAVRRGCNGSFTLHGFNTDCEGFRSTLPPQALAARQALVLGAGGASRAVGHALRSVGIHPIVVSRTPGKGDLTYDCLTPALVAASLLVVNTTPLGMWPDVAAAPPFPYQWLGSRHFCYDLIYNPEVTSFMTATAARGAATKNGLDMLYAQANAAWRLWISAPQSRR